MAITIDGTPNTVTPVISGNFAYTCSGTNRLLCVAVHLRTALSSDSVSVTYNGVGMNTGVSVDFATTGSKKAWLFYLVNPASGSNTLAYTFTGTAESVVTAISFNGVDQVNPTGGTGSNTSASGTSLTANITTVAANSLVLDAFNEGGGTPFTPGAGQTQRWGAATAVNGMTGYGSTLPVAAAGATNTSWSITGGATTLTLINLELRAAAGASLLSLLGAGT